MPLSVLMIGYGAIAGYVARALADDEDVRIAWVLARPGRAAAARAALGGQVRVAETVAGLDGRPDVAIECAGHGAVAEHGAAVLDAGIPLGLVSTGALADDALRADLARAAAAGGAALDLLSGAIAAVDALASAREGGLDRVRYTSRKPPLSWSGTPAEKACRLDALSEPFAFYRGTAREAARLYPKNANVAATIALAGLGFDDTEVELIADPDAGGNVHRVEAAGAFGDLDLTIKGKPLPDNPKSSGLTAMCAVRFLRNRARAVRI